MRMLTRLLLGLSVLAVGPIGLAGSATRQGQAVPYFSIEPGVSSKAVVDLTLGEPLRRIVALTYAYAPPRGVTDTRSVEVAFYPEDQTVARLDVHLDPPLDPQPLRDRFGTRVLVMDRERGGRDEYFYPQLLGLVFEGELPGDPVVAISYLSPRYLADVYVDRYNEHLRAERFEEARSAADTAVLVAPDYARGYGAQAHFLARRDRIDEAIEHYELATRARYPGVLIGRSYSRMAELLWREREKPDAAEAAFEAAVVRAPELAEVHGSFGQFLVARDRVDESVAHLSRAAELAPEDALAKEALADAYYRLRDWDNALPLYEDLAALADSEAGSQPTEAVPSEPWYRVAYCLQQLERRPEDALLAYERVIALSPSGVNAYWGASVVVRRLGQPGSAVSYLRRGLELEPDHFGLTQHLGNALLEAGSFESGLEAHTRAQALRPDDAPQMVNVARAFAALRKKNETRDWLRRAVAAGYSNRALLESDAHLDDLLGNDGEFRNILSMIRR